jgi:hypothetical protein
VHLHAAYLPPSDLLDRLADLVREQEPPPPEPEPPARRGLFGRRGEGAPVAAPPLPLLDVLDPVGPLLPITDFGFVQAATARSMVRAIAEATQRYQRPKVVFHGGAALVDDEDRHVWASIDAPDDGVDVMRGIAREVVSAVEPLGLFCDRRQFQPRLPLATVNDRTTVEHLEAVLAALDGYTSEPWEIGEVVILRRGAGVWEQVPVGA